MVLHFRGKSAEIGTSLKSRNLFVRRGRTMTFVRVGATFRRRRDDVTVETARVISIAPDASGIPHVRYESGLERGAFARIDAGPRTLNLASFAERFGAGA
jgi:hypothetical protein